MSINDLHALAVCVNECKRCPHHLTRNLAVFSKGDPLSTLAFVGEAPGEEENEQGLPFVGRSGQLLNKQISGMRGYAQEIGVEFPVDPYVLNCLKCRPPDNKLLSDGSDVAACADWLWAQLRLLPNLKVIVALGKVASTTLLYSEQSLGALRGQAYASVGTDPSDSNLTAKLAQPMFIVPTYHPAYLLRNTLNSKIQLEAWSDLKKAVEVLR